MSLIINMLKDLENKQPQHDVQPYIATMQDRSRFAFFESRQNTMITASIVAFTILLSTAIIKHHKPTGLHTMLPLEATIISNALPSDDSAWLNPGFVTGMTLQVKDNITEITLMLDHSMLYQIDSNDMRNQLILVIKGAQLRAELPAINYMNTALQNITANHNQTDTKFIFTLLPGASIKYVNLTDNAKNPELVIAIANPDTTATAVTTTTNNSTNTNLFTSSSQNNIKITAFDTVLAEAYQNALAAAAANNYFSAIDQLNKIIDKDPNFVDARVTLAALLIDQGFKIRAKKIVDDGLIINPDGSSLIELKARLLSDDGKNNEALTLLLSNAPTLSDNPDYHAFIAALYEKTNHYKLAANVYQQLLSLNGQNGNWWFGLGVALDKSGSNTSAINAYTRALHSGSRLNSETLAYVQHRLRQLGDTTDATE